VDPDAATKVSMLMFYLGYAYFCTKLAELHWRAAVRLTTPRLEGVIWGKKKVCLKLSHSGGKMEWQAQSRAPLTLPFSAIRTQEHEAQKKKKASPDILHRSSLSIRKIDFFFCGDPKDRLILSKKKDLDAVVTCCKNCIFVLCMFLIF
jgi:hypothetical protein